MTRVLIVDDSAVVRKTLARELERDPELTVVGTAADAYAARALILQTKPHVITLDLDMPRMNGLTFLEKLMRHHPLPVLIVSSLADRGSDAAMRALELGALDVIAKPERAYRVGDVIETLRRQIKLAALTDVRKLAQARRRPLAAPPPPIDPQHQRLVVIAASTGGPQAIETIVRQFPAGGPPTLIVQHMPAGFTRAFARRLDRLGPMTAREARAGDRPSAGLILVAPGGQHMRLAATDGDLRIELTQDPPLHFQRPSADHLFASAAAHLGAQAIGVVLTGMGVDGAEGLWAVRQAGGTTIAQDEATAVVFGMPQEAIARGAAEQVLALEAIAAATLEAARVKRAA